MAAQVQDATLKLSDEAPVFLCEANLDLTDRLASTALDPLNRQFYDDPLEAKAGSEKSSPGSAPLDHLSRTATCTSQRGRVLFDRENDLSPDIFSPAISVAYNIQGVVQ
jgi:hypothetical protein